MGLVEALLPWRLLRGAHRASVPEADFAGVPPLMSLRLPRPQPPFPPFSSKSQLETEWSWNLLKSFDVYHSPGERGEGWKSLCKENKENTLKTNSVKR